MRDERRPEVMVVMGGDAFTTGFDESRLARLAELGSIAAPLHATTFDTTAVRQRLHDVEVLLTGWQTPEIDTDVLAGAPKLRAIFHTAGTVKRIVSPACWERGIRVTTAADANAIPVSEYTVAAIVFAGKRVFETAHLYGRARRRVRPDGLMSNYGRTVGVIGYSRIGRRVVDLLGRFDFTVLVADPYAETSRIAGAGASHVELDELLTRSDIVSIHAPALPATRHMLGKEQLALIPDGGTVINTARGMLVDTAALATECASGRLSAVLDVTDPEPLSADTPLWDMPNVFLTPHVAGAQQTEVYRLVDSALDELDRYARGEAPLHGVTADELDRMA